MTHTCAPTTLSRFNDLPIEIRLRVWELALPGPRIVHAELKWLAGGHCSRVWSDKKSDTKGNAAFFDFRGPVNGVLGERYGPGKTFALKGPSTPGVFYACRESYQLASKSYSLSFGTSRALPSIWFNFQQDTLYLDVNFFDLLGLDLEVTHDLGSDISKVRNLALGFETSEEWDILPDTEIVSNLLSRFGNVEEIDLAVSHHLEVPDLSEELAYLPMQDIDGNFYHYETGFEYEEDRNWRSMPGCGSYELESLSSVDQLQTRLNALDASVVLRGRPGRSWAMPRIKLQVVTTQNFKRDFEEMKAAYEEQRRLFNVRFDFQPRDGTSFPYTVNQATTIQDIAMAFRRSRLIPSDQEIGIRHYGTLLKYSSRLLEHRDLATTDILEVSVRPVPTE